ncbi:MAG: alpha/beta hydrolase family protein [Hyphomonas sp.]
MRFYTVLCLVLALAVPGALSAAAQTPPLEAYGGLPRFSDAEISPDGTRIAAIVNSQTGSQLMVLNIDGTVIRQIGTSNIKARGVEFYDSEHVILLASITTRTYGFRGRYEFSGAYSINLATGNTVTLLDRMEGLFPAQSGLGRIIGRGSEDGTVLMPAFMGRATADPTKDLLRVNLRDGRGRSVLKGTTDTIDWFSDGEGGVLARERYDNRRKEYRVDMRRGSRWHTILEIKNVEIPPIFLYGTLPNNSGFAFIEADDEETFEGLMVLGVDGEVSGPILGRTGHEIDRIYTDDERRVLGVRYSGMTPDYEFLDAGLKASYETVSAALPDATIYLDSWSDDRQVVLYHVFDGGLGVGWILHHAGNGSIKLIARDRPDIPPEQMGAVLAIEYPARDGLTIPAVLTLPPGTDLENDLPLPLVVMPHGGPAAYDRLDFDWMAQFVASRGYMVLQPNFRGSTGFGKAFLDAGRGEWAGKMQDDLVDGVSALATEGMIDPSRVCIIGASYGGYAALAGPAFHADVYRCSIAIAPVTDLQAMLSEERQRFRGRHWVVSYWEGIMADGDARRQRLREASPINAADRIRAPVLLIHGEDDTVVPINQSVRMERALKRANKPVEFVRLEGEDHWLSGAETRIQLLREIDRFLAAQMPAQAAN